MECLDASRRFGHRAQPIHRETCECAQSHSASDRDDCFCACRGVQIELEMMDGMGMSE